MSQKGLRYMPSYHHAIHLQAKLYTKEALTVQMLCIPDRICHSKDKIHFPVM